MGERNAVRFFVRFLLLTVVTIILVTISVTLASMGGAGLIIGALIVVVNVLFLLFFLVMAFTNLIKHLFDKEKEHFEFLYIINLLFTLLITGVFLTFYFVLMAASMLFLIPILA